MKPSIIFSTLAIMSLIACSKISHESSNFNNTIEQLNSEEQFSKILAISLKNNAELSSFIIQEANNAFDGDNNILIAPNSDCPTTKGGVSFKEVLKHSYLSTKANEAINIDDLFDIIKSNSPLLQIYVMNPECYETTKGIKVVYIPEDFDEGITMSVPCYNEYGEKSMIATNNEYQNETIFVVSRNERTIAVSKIALKGEKEFKGAKPIYEDEYFNYYLIDNLYGTQPILTNGIDEILIPEEYKNCERYKLGKSRDYLYKVRPKNKSAWNKMEDPFLGDPELYVDILFGKYLGGMLGDEGLRKELPTGYKNRNNIQWKIHDIELLQWNLRENGKSMKYIWNERDAGNFITISIPFSVEFLDNQVLNGNIEVGVGKHDEKCGDAIVYYTDENNHQYDTGYVLYTVQFR